MRDAGQAQQPERMRRIGALMAHPDSDPEFRAYLAAFRARVDGRPSESTSRGTFR
jgi:hypothetical protein